MTIAALAFIPLTFVISSALRAAHEAGEGSSPLGPLLRTVPWIFASASSALDDTPASTPVVALEAELPPGVASSASRYFLLVAAASRGSPSYESSSTTIQPS